MTHPLFPPLIVKRDYSCLDELNEASSLWDAEFVQTGAGVLEVKTFSVYAPSLLFSHSSFSRQISVEALAPEGFRTFTIPSRPQCEYLSRGRRVCSDQIVVAPESRELVGTMRSGHSTFTLSVPLADLEPMSQICGFGLEAATRRGAFYSPSPEALERFRHVLRAALATGHQGGGAFWFYNACEAIKAALASCLASVHEPACAPPSRQREKVFSRVMQYVRANLHRCPTVSDLCQAGNVSERTLQYIFREHLAVTPKMFIKAYSLKRVYQELNSGTAKNVTDAATKWGFWHMGQFAADYRRLFGILPSATLKNAIKAHVR